MFRYIYWSYEDGQLWFIKKWTVTVYIKSITMQKQHGHLSCFEYRIYLKLFRFSIKLINIYCASKTKTSSLHNNATVRIYRFLSGVCCSYVGWLLNCVFDTAENRRQGRLGFSNLLIRPESRLNPSFLRFPSFACFQRGAVVIKACCGCYLKL